MKYLGNFSTVFDNEVFACYWDHCTFGNLRIFSLIDFFPLLRYFCGQKFLFGLHEEENDIWISNRCVQEGVNDM